MNARLGYFVVLIVSVFGTGVTAQSLVATRTIRANSVLSAEDVMLVSASIPGVASKETAVIGQETRVAIYQGHPIRSAELGPPALVDRNQMVVLFYRSGALVITAEGRALARAGAGERVKAMNMTSHTTVAGIVAPDGSINVTP